MQGRLPVSGLFLAFSISTGLSGTVHIAAAEEKGEMKGRLQVPSFHPASRHAGKYPAAALSNPTKSSAPGTAILGFKCQCLGPPPTDSSVLVLGTGQPGQQNSTCPQGSCMHLNFENHHSTGFLHDLSPTQPVLRSYGACYGSCIFEGVLQEAIWSPSDPPHPRASWLHCVNWPDWTVGTCRRLTADSLIWALKVLSSQMSHISWLT